MNLRIAYYLVALAISLAAFGAAYNYAATNANATAAAGATAASNRHGLQDGWGEIARAASAASAASAANATTAALTAYAIAGAVSLAAFSGAYILDKRRGIAEMVGRCSRAYLDFNKHVKKQSRPENVWRARWRPPGTISNSLKPR